MTLGMGKCVADGSQGSCLMITSVHDKQFIRSIWTVMLTKEILFSIELWHEMSPECTIMNQRIRDNQSSGNTHCLRPTKSTRHRLPLGKSCWPSFSGTILVHFRQKGETVTGARYSDMLVNDLKPAVWSKRWELLSKWVLLLHNNARPIRLHIQWIHYVLWNLRCWNIHLRSRLGAFGLSLVWTYERIFAGPEVCRWWGNGGGAKLVKGHANKPFSRGHPQACRQVDQVCCEAVGLC